MRWFKVAPPSIVVKVNMKCTKVCSSNTTIAKVNISRRALGRQVSEWVLISTKGNPKVGGSGEGGQGGGGVRLMNSKTEWNGEALPRITIEGAERKGEGGGGGGCKGKEGVDPLIEKKGGARQAEGRGEGAPNPKKRKKHPISTPTPTQEPKETHREPQKGGKTGGGG